MLQHMYRIQLYVQPMCSCQAVHQSLWDFCKIFSTVTWPYPPLLTCLHCSATLIAFLSTVLQNFLAVCVCPGTLRASVTYMYKPLVGLGACRRIALGLTF